MKKETRQMFENYKWELVELAKKVGAIEQDRNKLEKFTKRLDTYQNRLAEIEQHNETGSQLNGTSMELWRAAARKQIDTLEVRMDNLSINDMGQAERIGKLERRLDGAAEDRGKILEKYKDFDSDLMPGDNLTSESRYRLIGVNANALFKGIVEDTIDLPQDTEICLMIAPTGDYEVVPHWDLKLADLRKLSLNLTGV